MKVSKKFPIAGFIITSNDIVELAKEVYAIHEKVKEPGSIGFVLTTADGTKYETKDVESILTEGILDKRRVVGVRIYYYSYSSDKKIDINLRHTVVDVTSENLISLSSSDEAWTNGVIKSFEDITANWEKQSIWPHKYTWPLTIGLAITLGLLYIWILNFLFTHLIVIRRPHLLPSWITKLGPIFEFASYFTAIVLVGGFPAELLVSKLKELYPVVELKTGPEYTQIEAKRRKLLYATIVVVIIPLVIGFVIKIF